MSNIIANLKLADQGFRSLAWAEKEMPVVKLIEKEFTQTKPFLGKTIGLCLHITKETGVLLRLLKNAGASVYACGSNPLSTQDDIAAALAKDGIHIFAKRGVSNKEYYALAERVINSKPDLLVDDGADLIGLIHSRFPVIAQKLIGALEETTTGVVRIKAMEKHGALKFPVIAVNESQTKHLFDNHFGTGQSTVDGILRATNIMLAGKIVVIAGFGQCGSGLAKVLTGEGAKVIVTEINPIKALRAAMAGYWVMTMDQAARLGDVFVTVTGNKSVITLKHMKTMKDGAILCNAGHFNIEIEVKELTAAAKTKPVRENLTQHVFPQGKSVFLIAEGRLVNLAAAEGHPSAVMDMSFSNQALGLKYLLEHRSLLENQVYVLPETIDIKIAGLKLKAMGVKIDKLTQNQQNYLTSWQSGT